MLANADIFYGASSPQQATLYVRLPRESVPADATLRGSVTGPYCALASTLPSRTILRDLGPGATRLASAAILDPVFWSAKVPARYRVEFELVSNGNVLAQEERLVGIRALGILKSDLRQEGKRIVLRMVHRGEAAALPLSAWRQAEMGMLGIELSDADCEEASNIGVMITVLAQGTAEQVTAQLKRYARHAAAAIAIVDGNLDTAPQLLRDAAPNLLLFQPESAEDHMWEAAPWAQGIMAPALNAAQFALAAGSCDLPVLATRPLGPTDDLATARAACDRLQRDLAPYCQCAGYIV